jgi:hypothetical protein
MAFVGQQNSVNYARLHGPRTQPAAHDRHSAILANPALAIKSEGDTRFISAAIPVAITYATAKLTVAGAVGVHQLMNTNQP